MEQGDTKDNICNKIWRDASGAPHEQRAPGRRPPIIDFQNEIVEMYVRREGVEQVIENGRGRRFIRRAFDRRLGTNQTSSIMANFRRNINTSFYIFC